MDWQTSLGLCQTQSVTRVYFPNWQGTGVLWYRDLRRVTRDLCLTSGVITPETAVLLSDAESSTFGCQEWGANPATAGSITKFALCACFCVLYDVLKTSKFPVWNDFQFCFIARQTETNAFPRYAHAHLG